MFCIVEVFQFQHRHQVHRISFQNSVKLDGENKKNASTRTLIKFSCYIKRQRLRSVINSGKYHEDFQNNHKR